jgi:Ras GTPase-activating-like protein IQGAP2/3
LYNKKNIPKVIYCIHALSFLLFRLGLTNHAVGNLVGKLEFTETEIQNIQKGLDTAGVSLPAFRGVNKHFEIDPEPEPVETEEERIARELREVRPDIVELQCLCRGALLRIHLGDMMEELWDSEGVILDLQARIRGMFARISFGYRADISRWATNLQAMSRGYMARQNFRHQQQFCDRNQQLFSKLQARIRANKVREEVLHQRKQLEEVEEKRKEVSGLQSAARGFLVRQRLVAQADDVFENEDNIVRLQAMARGALVRMRKGDLVADLFDQEDLFTRFQAALRGRLVRDRVHKDTEALEEAEESFADVGAVARGVLVRRRMQQTKDALAQEETAVETLQAAARGMLIRASMQQTKDALVKEEDAVTTLQAAVRGMFIRAAMQKDQQELQAVSEDKDNSLPILQGIARGYLLRLAFNADKKALEDNIELWLQLQAAARGTLVRWDYRWKLLSLAETEDDIIEIQACAQGALVRSAYQEILQQLDEAVDGVVGLQSLCRGALVRWEVLDTNAALEDEVDSIVELQAHARGFLHRLQREEFLAELESEVDSVVEMQALIRGTLVRWRLDDIVMAVQDQEDAILELQSAARGVLQRTCFQAKLKHYRDNMDKVIKLQSFVRAKQQGEAYKSLMGGKNPPVGTVKNFVHLLNDSDFDFDEEIEFENMRKKVVQHVRANELAEAYVDQLDVKIALLVKNKITLDEVIKHQKRFTGHVGNLLSNTDIASSDPFDLKALNNNSRKRLERYQQMFYALQTQPQYLSRLFRRVRETNTADKELKRIENLVMGIFGYSQKRREEFYLLKLIVRSVKEEVSKCERPEDFLRTNFFWVKLVGSYIRSPRDRKFLRDLLAPLIREEFIDNEELDLESDPLQIYRASINNEELRTGMRSQRDPDVGRDQAIRDPETRETFIAHLQALRTLAEDFMNVLDNNVERMPYGIRYIARKSIEALLERFPDENEEVIVQVVLHFVFSKYFSPALNGPDAFGIVAKSLTPIQKKNLAALSKLLNQITSGRLFANENMFLQPLNEYVSIAIGQFKEVFKAVVDVPTIEARFEIDAFEDLTSKTKPTLYMKMSDIFAIHRLIASEIETIAESREDPLREIIGELGSVQTSESELKNVGNTEIALQLDPSFQVIDDPESEIKALFVETKRCILFIIRIQTGNNLMDILVKPITAEDEAKWDALLAEEAGNAEGKKRGAYADHTMLTDINAMSYAQLKRTALENIIKLERVGKITRKNQYQDILNEIAIDIRTKHRRRVQRSREMDGVQQTLQHLQEKAVYLESQLKSYNDYIEQAMVTLQTKKGKRRTVLPFTRQYFHMRELSKAGRVPKFGSYKYSARALADKGVLVKLEGYNEKRWDKVFFTISSDDVGCFFVEAANGSMMIPGASAQVLLDDLLQVGSEGGWGEGWMALTSRRCNSIITSS